MFVTWQCFICFAAYRRPFIAIPSEPCLGDTVTLPCEVLFSENGSTLIMTSSTVTRDGVIIAANNIPNHMLLSSGPNVVGVMISGVALSDNGVEYNCTHTFAPDDFMSSLILNVTGKAYKCIYITCV